MNTSVDKNESGWENLVRQQVRSIRFGVVQIIVHDHRVVQIERTEKVRLDSSADSASPKSTEN